MWKFALVAWLALAAPAAAQTVRLTGPQGTQELDAAALSAMPHISATMNDHGTMVTYEGVPLRALATLAGAPEGEKLRGPALATFVRVTASDGYKVVLSLGEIDATLGAGTVILADRQDGKPLNDKQGPFRLVVDGDQRPARSARSVTTVEIVNGG